MAGSKLHDGLLNRAPQGALLGVGGRWLLTLGVPQGTWLRRFGQTVLLGAMGLMLAWVSAHWLDAWRARTWTVDVLLATPLALVWTLCWRHGWRSWTGPASVRHLVWAPPADADEPVFHQWRVAEWSAEPVEIRSWLDWGVGILLSVSDGRQTAWAWAEPAGNDLHQLRALLAHAPGVTAAHGAIAQVVASWQADNTTVRTQVSSRQVLSRPSAPSLRAPAQADFMPTMPMAPNAHTARREAP